MTSINVAWNGRWRAWLAAILLCTGTYATAAAAPESSSPGQGVVLPFLDPPGPDGAIQHLPRLYLSFGAERHIAVMDTGSTGVVVAASMIPNLDRLQHLGPATMSYSSSGVVLHGDWVVAPLTITGANGATFATAPMPVLAVQEITCYANARRCRPQSAPRRIAMLGVGFAREHDHQARGTPDKNPFLHPAEPGPLHHGYVVTRQAVQVGLAATPPAGFTTVSLARNAAGNDWQPLPACLSLDGRTPADCGSALIDTGIAGMFLTVSSAQVAGLAERGSLRPGTKISIQFGTRAFDDQVTIGGVGPRAPAWITLVNTGRGAPFVNTGFHALNRFDYLFDADTGTVGFRSLQ